MGKMYGKDDGAAWRARAYELAMRVFQSDACERSAGVRGWVENIFKAHLKVGPFVGQSGVEDDGAAWRARAYELALEVLYQEMDDVRCEVDAVFRDY